MLKPTGLLDISSLVRGIHYTQIENIWPDIEPWITKSCERGGGKYLSSDIKEAILKRDMQLWVAGDIEAIAITGIINYPQKRYLRIHLGAGEYRKYFKEFIKVSELWARQEGCSGGEAVTHKIFAKLFKLLGWKLSHIYMEKDF